jgi:hypothetical protein
MKGPSNPQDEGVVLVYPELLEKGLVVHRDFESPYPPGNIWFLEGVYEIFGTGIQVERSVGVLYQIVLLAGIFYLFRSRGAGVATAGCILATLVMMRLGNVAFAWLGGTALAVWTLAMLTQDGKVRTRAILAGVFAGLTLTWRLDLAPALILSIGGYCFLAKWRVRDFLWLILAGSVALIPLLIHAIIVTPSVFLDNVFYTPVIRSHNGRGLPLNFSNAYVGQLYALVVVSILAALSVGWRMRKAEEGRGLALFAFALFVLGVFPEAVQRADIWHLSNAAALALPLLVLTGSFLSSSSLMPVYVLGAVVMALPQMVKIISTIHSKDYGTNWVTNGSRVIGATFPDEQLVIDYIRNNARPNQALFVGAKDLRFTNVNDVDIYHLFPSLRPASYFLELNPLSANRPGSRLADDIAKADWVILDSMWNHSHEPNGSAIPGPDAPNQVIAKKFKLVLSADPFELYQRIAD